MSPSNNPCLAARTLWDLVVDTGGNIPKDMIPFVANEYKNRQNQN